MQRVAQPISFSHIKGKLDGVQYPTVSSLAADLHQMFTNATSYYPVRDNVLLTPAVSASALECN
jgi:hypothetical protein